MAVAQTHSGSYHSIVISYSAFNFDALSYINRIFVCSKHAHSAMENLKKFPRITSLFQEEGEGKEQEGREINSTTFT